MTPDVETEQLPMICTCSPEGAAHAVTLRADVMGRLAQGSARLRPHSVTDQNFLSSLCLSLHADLRANVSAIYMDQWFAVVVEQLLPSNLERRVVVQADAAEDGLAAIWDFLMNSDPGDDAMP